MESVVVFTSWECLRSKWINSNQNFSTVPGGKFIIPLVGVLYFKQRMGTLSSLEEKTMFVRRALVAFTSWGQRNSESVGSWGPSCRNSRSSVQDPGWFPSTTWRSILRVPWTAGRSHRSSLKEISSKYSMEGLMLMFQWFGHLMQRADSLGKILMLGKTEGQRRGQQRMRRLDGITDSADRNLSELQEVV